MPTSQKPKSPKLPLTHAERTQLRRAKLRLTDIEKQSPEPFSSLLGISVERARELIALAAFQTIPSIGPKLAEDLVRLGYYSLDELRGRDGAELIDTLELIYGCQIDPCVEDQIRCVIHHADYPDSQKQWWEFTEERKSFRAQHGYPPTRPASGN
ncbi:helix-hairpin-helix domain-containing protein [Brevibacillus ruminantium]|uniref:Helix-hairpin-helix domain-containing protein n=1 Tax=Brevibacillus ruminantium TaxID=2950604 RepID=A0ABY4WID1_9BACL|nr:helix-hairpin-helix domain-containing protein [Brevibacillus ruminantium]USG66464.1 helix-hairpin-helix domain-containing protein [Brevibacillus ruminantium]